MMRHRLLLPLLLLSVGALHARVPSAADGFIENRGQWPDDVRYRVRLNGLTLWITDRGVAYDLNRREGMDEGGHTSTLYKMQAISASDRQMSLKGHVLHAEFDGASPHSRATGEGVMSGTINYLFGNDPERWGRNCRIYSSIRLARLYDGIDAIYYFDRGLPRYDLMVAPGADVAQVRLAIRGGGDMRMLTSGRLVIETSLGDLEMRELTTYQLNERGEKCQVSSRFILHDDATIGITVGEYDRTRPLIVDPLVYSTVIGGNGRDNSYGIAVDREGHAYIAGVTSQEHDFERVFPATPGAYQRMILGLRDIFVTKLSPDGSRLEYSTYLGGSDNDVAEDLVIDAEGHVYVVGGAIDTGLGVDRFPTTVGAYRTTPKGGQDAILIMLSVDGSTLEYSTYLGGGGVDLAYGIAIDSVGSIYVTGTTQYTGQSATTFPTTPGAYRTVHRGGFDAFVTKMSPDLSSLAYSTLIGGRSDDHAFVVEVDVLGNAVIAGRTRDTGVAASNYPITPGAYDSSHGGGIDLFVTKLNADASRLIFSTVIGGAREDEAHGLSIDRNDGIYIVGNTVTTKDSTTEYPTTRWAYDTAHAGSADVFVTKLSPDGSRLEYSTFIGGPRGDRAHDVMADEGGAVYLCGMTDAIGSPLLDFPSTPGAFSENSGNGLAAFLTRLSPDGSEVLYSTFLGESAGAVAYALARDAEGYFYLTGNAGATQRPEHSFPTTENAFDRTIDDAYYPDAFVTKIDLAVSSTGPDHPASSLRIDLR